MAEAMRGCSAASLGTVCALTTRAPKVAHISPAATTTANFLTASSQLARATRLPRHCVLVLNMLRQEICAAITPPTPPPPPPPPARGGRSAPRPTPPPQAGEGAHAAVSSTAPSPSIRNTNRSPALIARVGMTLPVITTIPARRGRSRSAERLAIQASVASGSSVVPRCCSLPLISSRPSNPERDCAAKDTGGPSTIPAFQQLSQIKESALTVL